MKMKESGEKVFELSDFGDDKKREELFSYVEQKFSKEQLKQIALAMLKVLNEADVKIIANINLTPDVMFRLRQIGQEEKEAAIFFKDEESINLLLQLTADEIQEARYLFNIEEISSIQDYYKVKNKTEKDITEEATIVEQELVQAPIEISLKKPEIAEDIAVDNPNAQLEEIISVAESLAVSEADTLEQEAPSTDMEGFANISSDDDKVFFL